MSGLAQSDLFVGATHTSVMQRQSPPRPIARAESHDQWDGHALHLSTEEVWNANRPRLAWLTYGMLSGRNVATDRIRVRSYHWGLGGALLLPLYPFAAASRPALQTCLAGCDSLEVLEITGRARLHAAARLASRRITGVVLATGDLDEAGYEIFSAWLTALPGRLRARLHTTGLTPQGFPAPLALSGRPAASWDTMVAALQPWQRRHHLPVGRRPAFGKFNPNAH